MKMLALTGSLALVCGVGCTAVAATLAMPPAVPQPSKNGDQVGFILQNPGTTAAPAHWITFGQVFPIDAVAPTDSLYAREGTANRSVQMDVLATHPDGSVRFAAITTSYPKIPAGGSLSGMLALHGAYSEAPVNLAALAPQLTVELTVTASPLGAFSKTIDLGAALQTSLASGSPDYWLHGPLATEARVDVLVGASFHITADVTGYKNGVVSADVQFNNDLAMGKTGGTFSYGATITLNKMTEKFAKIVQDQYQDWHAQVAAGGLPAVNVQHDVANLERTGAILTYDLTTGVNVSVLQSYAALAQSAGFGTPLAVNGLTQFMPETGGRGDIGYTTQWDTVWLVTQDARAATVGLAQGDTGGAVPWNMKLAAGRWLTPHDYAGIWIDPRGNVSLTQQTANTAWVTDAAHQPNLAYVPYLMTAARWYLDRLNAQAAWSMSIDYPGIRCLPAGATCTASNDWHTINLQDQPRQQAWSNREITEAGWIGKPGSFEGGYFSQVTTQNWQWLASQSAGLGGTQGQAAGWLPGAYKTLNAIPPWQQDYFTGIAVLAARMGDAGAQQVLTWNQNWVAQRFIAPGMNPHDGCIYSLMVSDPTTNNLFATWSQIEQATVAAGDSNGNGWAQSNGDYCQLARAGLGGMLSVQPTNTAAQQALTWLQGSGAPYISQSAFQTDPTFNVVP